MRVKTGRRRQDLQALRSEVWNHWLVIPPPLSRPEFWEKQGYPTFSKFWEICNRPLDALNKLTLNAGKAKDTTELIIRYLCMSVGISYADVGLLVGNGSGISAMKIVRTALESAINAEYLRKEPGEHRAFMDWHFVEQYRRLEYMRKHMTKEYANLNPTMVSETERRYLAVRPNFLNKNNKLRGSWCALNLRERALRTGFEEMYNIVYVLASELSHGSFGGIAQHVEKFETEGVQPAIPPSLTECEEALSSAHYCTLRSIETLVTLKGLDSTPALSELKSEYSSVWSNTAPAP